MSRPSQLESNLARAIHDPENWVIWIHYKSPRGLATARVVSPIRIDANNCRFLALCLGREEPRWFSFSNVRDHKLLDAKNILAPIPVQELD